MKVLMFTLLFPFICGFLCVRVCVWIRWNTYTRWIVIHVMNIFIRYIIYRHTYSNVVFSVSVKEAKMYESRPIISVLVTRSSTLNARTKHSTTVVAAFRKSNYPAYNILVVCECVFM